MTKKLLSLLVAVLMVLALVPMGALAKANVGVEANDLKITTKDFEMKKIDKVTRSASSDTRDELFVDGSLLNSSFESNTEVTGWWAFDADEDDNNWGRYSGAEYAQDGTYFMGSYSYSNSTGNLNTDNWLCTPDMIIPTTGGYYLTFYSMSFDPDWLDDLEVLVGVYGEAYDDNNIDTSAWTTAMQLTTIPAEWTQYVISLDAYAGMTVSVAFRHHCSGQWLLLLDNVKAGYSGNVVDETGVNISQSTLALNVCDAEQLTASVVPSNATYQTVTWSSSDPTVAAVNMNGGVMGLAPGTATIYATSHNGTTAACVVTVSDGGYGFSEDLQAFTVYDLDTGNSPNSFYSMDQYGTMELLYAADYDLKTSEYNGGDGLLYGFVDAGDGTYNFVSIDVKNNYAVKVISTAKDDSPSWMAYGFDTGEMYAGYVYYDEDDNLYCEIAVLDLTSGDKGEVLVDVYNESFEYNGETYTYQLIPLYATYVGDGIFVAADYNYESLMMYAPDYEGEGFACAYLGDYEIKDMLGSNFQTYIQKMWYDPFDGMIYWASIMNYTCSMTVIDVVTGIAVNTGITGPAGAVDGMETVSIFEPYIIEVPTYIVTFVDGLTNEPIAEVEVEEGEDATPPTPPVHEGYSFDHWDGDYTNVTDNVTVTAVYTLNSYTLTIEYYNEDGVEIAPAYTAQVPYGTAYEVPSPEIEGYTTETTLVSGTMPAENVDVKVIYTAVEVPPAGLPGDVNCDGQVTMADLSALCAYVLGKADLTAQGFANADVNGDGNVNSMDLPLIYQLTLVN